MVQLWLRFLRSGGHGGSRVLPCWCGVDKCLDVGISVVMTGLLGYDGGRVGCSSVLRLIMIRPVNQIITLVK